MTVNVFIIPSDAIYVMGVDIQVHELFGVKTCVPKFSLNEYTRQTFRLLVFFVFFFFTTNNVISDEYSIFRGLKRAPKFDVSTLRSFAEALELIVYFER